jgi:hypothetical protein
MPIISRIMNSPTKPARPRQADAGQRRDHEQRRVDRHAVGEAAEVGDLARVAALVDHPDQEEQRAGREAVVDHLEIEPLEALRRQREHAEHHEAEVADRRVGDQLLDVRLHQATSAP